MCRTCFAHRREWKFITFVKWQNQEGPWDTLPWAARWLFTFLPRCDAEEVFITVRGLFKQTLGDGEGQESLECCSPWFRRIVHDLATEHNSSQHLHLNKPLSQLRQNAAENSQPVFPVDPHLWTSRYVLLWILAKLLAVFQPFPHPHTHTSGLQFRTLLHSFPWGFWYSFLSATFHLSQQVFLSLNLREKRLRFGDFALTNLLYCWVCVCSVMSNCLRPWWQPTRLLCPWDSPGKDTGVGCHLLGDSGGPSWPRDRISCIGRWALYH